MCPLLVLPSGPPPLQVNNLLPGHPHCTLALYAALLGYLCCGMVTTHFALRASLDLLLAGPNAPFTWKRQVSMHACHAVPAASRPGHGVTARLPGLPAPPTWTQRVCWRKRASLVHVSEAGHH